MKKIAIQGVPGSYHDIAAHKFFPGEEIELICCSTFEEIFSNMKQDSNVIGMLAIENTIVQTAHWWQAFPHASRAYCGSCS